MTHVGRSRMQRAAVALLVGAALLAAAFGARTRLSLCTADCCAEAVPFAARTPLPDEPDGAAASCACCREHAAGPGAATATNRGRCEDGCCLELQLTIASGPLPERVVCKDSGPEPAGRPVRPVVPLRRAVPAEAPTRPATGPPRPDPRTQLLSSTILRL